jgi:DNA-directed RNA polymerase subunit RPC12/RpoP
MKKRDGIPRWPRWYCSFFHGHWGYLREVDHVDEKRSEYICEACGWRGMKERPPKKVRLFGF